MGSYPYITIKNFIGMSKSTDKISLLPGQLSRNDNYLYMSNGGLYERGGGAELVANPSGGRDPVFSLANYVSPNGNNFLITNQDSTAYYYSSGWNNLSFSLATDKKVRWENAGFESNRSIYGVNGIDPVIKITGDVPVGSLVSDSPTDMIMLKLHKNRLFGINGKDTLYFTDVLDFEEWDTSVNTIEVAPGIDGDIFSIEIWGDALFIFKEYGVYVLPNADDPIPSENWAILRSDASTGTRSTDSVKRTRVGIFYVSSDNYIRMISPSITFSSGEYSLGGSGSPIVSEDIQDDLINLWDTTERENVQAISYKDLYIVSLESVNNGGNYNDLTYFADTSKFNQLPGVQQLQPYWGQFTGFDYDFFAIQTLGGESTFFGAKGVTGNIQETLNDKIHNDNSFPIKSKAILGWFPLGGDGLFKRIQQIYFSGDTEAWNIDLIFNSYKLGKVLPGEGEGVAKFYSTSSILSSGVGTGIVGSSNVGVTGVGTSKYRLGLKGHYFVAEFGNENVNEFTRILKMIVYYRPIRQS